MNLKKIMPGTEGNRYASGRRRKVVFGNVCGKESAGI